MFVLYSLKTMDVIVGDVPYLPPVKFSVKVGKGGADAYLLKNIVQFAPYRGSPYIVTTTFYRPWIRRKALWRV